jgi:RNA polymerase sigma-70 factor, ECF subfamily
VSYWWGRKPSLWTDRGDRAVSGDEFVREAYASSYRRLVAQLLALCGEQTQAEDAVQEAFVKAIGQGDRFAHLDNPEAWLRTVALNNLRNGWRHHAVFRRIMPKVPGSVATLDLSPDHVAVVTALGAIPYELRLVVVLHHIADLPTAEIAAQTGIPEGTVKTRLVKGRALLATLLSDDEEANHV